MVIDQDSTVVITQSLGGTYTIHVPSLGGLYRIGNHDLDALGIEVTEGPSQMKADGPLEEKVWDALKSCYDPEIPVNIVDLGLIYDMKLEADQCAVKMTLTAPGCGMGPAIAADARQKILQLPEINEATVDVVWDPPWAPEMISPEGKKKLGIEG
ncbi:MAG: iron-sulfur cluster assembly protein [Verrucomicrobiota bacterium]